MKILINVPHPNLSAFTVNEAWVERPEGEPEVTIRKIYESYPDGKIDAAAEQEVLFTHDQIVFQRPFYWYSTPPLMKQRLNQVLAYNWAYGPKGRMLEEREWIPAISTGGPAGSYRAGRHNNLPISELMKPPQRTANLVHLKFLPASIFNGAVQAAPVDAEKSAERLAKRILDPLPDSERRLVALNEKMDGEGAELRVD